MEKHSKDRIALAKRTAELVDGQYAPGQWVVFWRCNVDQIRPALRGEVLGAATLQDSELSKLTLGASGQGFKGALDLASEGSLPEEAWLQPTILSSERVGTLAQHAEGHWVADDPDEMSGMQKIRPSKAPIKPTKKDLQRSTAKMRLKLPAVQTQKTL